MRLTNRTRLLSIGLTGLLAAGIIGGAGLALADQPGAGGPGAGQQGGPNHNGERGHKLGRITVEQLIKASGLDKQVVRQGLKEDKSLREVFAANQVDTGNVVTSVLGGLDARLKTAVTENKLTQEQAQKILAAAKEALPKILDQHGKPGHEDGQPGGHERVRHGSISIAATTIGISEQDLLKELKAGKTIAQVATAHNVTAQAVITAMDSAANAAIDKAAASGKIKPEKVAKAKEKALAAITKLVNEGRPHR